MQPDVPNGMFAKNPPPNEVFRLVLMSVPAGTSLGLNLDKFTPAFIPNFAEAVFTSSCANKAVPNTNTRASKLIFFISDFFIGSTKQKKGRFNGLYKKF